jgi:hypothetical protein
MNQWSISPEVDVMRTTMTNDEPDVWILHFRTDFQWCNFEMHAHHYLLSDLRHQNFMSNSASLT